MRLIDANYILEGLGHFNDRVNGDPHFLNGIETAKELIENAPTIDAIPIELTAQHLGRAFFSEPEKWADWLRMIRDGVDDGQEVEEDG